jgi:hypothetical protein
MGENSPNLVTLPIKAGYLQANPWTQESFKLDRLLYTKSRLTRWVCEKIAQNVAQPIFVKINS